MGMYDLSYLFLSENQSVCSPRWHAIANMPIFFIRIYIYIYIYIFNKQVFFIFFFSLLINNFEGILYSTLHIKIKIKINEEEIRNE